MPKGLRAGVASGTNPLLVPLAALPLFPQSCKTYLVHLIQTLISKPQPLDHLHFNLGELNTLDLRKKPMWSGAHLLCRLMQTHGRELGSHYH